MKITDTHVQLGLLVIGALAIGAAIFPIGKKARAMVLLWFAAP